MGVWESFRGLIRFRCKLYYAGIKAFMNRGGFVYSINSKIDFVCTNQDYFSKIIFISGGHEKTEMRWCERWLSNFNHEYLIIDCGANIGFFSSYCAQLNPLFRIVAIEGNKRTFGILQGNIKKMDLNNIKTHHAILAESKDIFYNVPDFPGREPWQQAISTQEPVTETLTLDCLEEVYYKIPDFIKIDCEGFEVKILKGATHILNQNNSVFFVECNDAALEAAGNTRNELFDIFRLNNFLLFHLSSFDMQIPTGVEVKNDFPSKEFNFAAIPDKDPFLKKWNAVLSQFKL
jgi:FkbM family methyltransferase